MPSRDLTTLPGWESLSSGTHNITIVAKAAGYKDSEPSAAVSVTKSSVKFVQIFPTTTADNYTLFDNLIQTKKGAYVVEKANGHEDVILLATGSEVDLAVKTKKLLLEKGVDAKVVSMPSTYLFDLQSEEYKKEILSLPREKVISVEMLSTFGWHKYSAHPYGIDTFGTSAPAKAAIRAYHFLPEDLCEFVLKVVK